jgi:hypothetical protein
MCLKNTKPFPFEMIGDERGDVLLIVHHKDLHAFASFRPRTRRSAFRPIWFGRMMAT